LGVGGRQNQGVRFEIFVVSLL